MNIKPWENTLKDIEEKEKRIKWKDREPYAYWKGNPYVSSERGDLMKCRPDKDHDWYARLYEVVRTILNESTTLFSFNPLNIKVNNQNLYNFTNCYIYF